MTFVNSNRCSPAQIVIWQRMGSFAEGERHIDGIQSWKPSEIERDLDLETRAYGSGAITVINPASSAVAPTVPSLAYIAPANKGNPAAKDERTALFAAIADAAIGRYATTR
jgi:hypothetical protein